MNSESEISTEEGCERKVKDTNRDYLQKRLQDIIHTALTENTNTSHSSFFIQAWRKSSPETQQTPGVWDRDPDKRYAESWWR